MRTLPPPKPKPDRRADWTTLRELFFACCWQHLCEVLLCRAEKHLCMCGLGLGRKDTGGRCAEDAGTNKQELNKQQFDSCWFGKQRWIPPETESGCLDPLTARGQNRVSRSLFLTYFLGRHDSIPCTEAGWRSKARLSFKNWVRMTAAVLCTQCKLSWIMSIETQPSCRSNVEKGWCHDRVDFGRGCDGDQWDSSVCGMLYFVNILINILSLILQLLHGPNHQGQHMQHTDERDRENKSPRSLL